MTEQTIEATRLDASILKKMDMFLEDFYPEGKEAGEEMAQKKMSTNQIRGLESVIISTTRFSEIFNYIKNQIGKEKKNNPWKMVGKKLLEQLEKIEKKSFEIEKEDPAVRMEVKLRLARGWARQVVAHYLYTTPEEGRR